MHRTRLGLVALTLIMLSLTIGVPAGVSHASALTGYVSEVPLSQVDVTVDPGKIVAFNNLSLGFMLDQEWKYYVSDTARRALARDVGFKLVRVFDFKDTSPHPCTWSQSAAVCQWSEVDPLVQRILEIGAEPMFVLGASGSNGPQIPLGMPVDTKTNLPYPVDFAAYASQWVRHFRSAGLPVRYYEIWNEPFTYFGRNPVDLTKLQNYMQLFNKAAIAMRQENPDVSISFDSIARKSVMDYWLANGGADVDSLDFHKYDSWVVGQETDQRLFTLAESDYFGTYPLGQSVIEARQAWFNARGKLLPIINSESNLNSASTDGTDPRIQQMTGAVWTALLLRMSIIKGLRYSVYYSLSSSASYGQKRPSGGAGFGMINSDNNRPWYPYYAQQFVGRNLSVDDPLLAITSSSEDVRTLAWSHNGMLNIFLVCKVNGTRTVNLQGVTGEASFFKIDNTAPWTTPSVQTGLIDVTKAITVTGYTVALLVMPLQLPTVTYAVTFYGSNASGSLVVDGLVMSDGVTANYSSGARVHVIANPPNGLSFAGWETSGVSVDNQFSQDTYMTITTGGWLKAHFTLVVQRRQ